MSKTHALTPDELAAFLASPLPRDVPVAVRRKLRGRGRRFLMLFGAWFLLMGVVFSWIFVPRRPWATWRMSGAELAQAEGEVVASEATNFTPRRGSDEVYLRHEFEFRAADRRLFRGVSFDRRARDVGEPVVIEYLEEDPDLARISGGALDPVSPLALVVLVVPWIGGLTLFFALRSRRRLLRILRRGPCAEAQVELVEATSVSVNDARRYRVTLRLGEGLEEQRMRLHAYGESVDLAESKRAAGESISVLVDPDASDSGLFIEQLRNTEPF